MCICNISCAIRNGCRLLALLDTLNDELTILIPYRDGDGSDPANHRPVSLLGTVYKILTKTVASRLEKVQSDIVNVTMWASSRTGCGDSRGINDKMAAH